MARRGRSSRRVDRYGTVQLMNFMDLFKVVDSDGTSASRYRLRFLGSMLQNQESWMWGQATEFAYLLFQLMILPANALLGAVLDSGRWLDPLSGFYQRIASPIYAVAPPWAIAALGLGWVAVSTLRAKPRFAGEGFGSDSMQRIGSALALAATVLVLTANPFALLSKVLELANGFAVGLASALTGNGSTTMTAGTSLVDASIRTPTIALNYGGQFSAACQSHWSESMLTGSELDSTSGCFAAGANSATPASFGTALLMLLFPALPMLVFAVIAAWRYLVHLTASAVCLLATGWIAAIAIFKRRGFEKLAAAFAHAAAHLVMAMVTSMLAVAMPVACAGLANQLLGIVTNSTAQVFVLMVSLGAGFAVSALAIIRATSKHGALVRILQADANTNLTKYLGVKLKKDEAAAAKGRAGDRTAPGKGAVAGRKRSALAEDPKAATAASTPAGADRAQAGASTSDTAVTELMAAASSVAESAGTSSAAAPSATATASAGATAGEFTVADGATGPAGRSGRVVVVGTPGATTTHTHTSAAAAGSPKALEAGPSASGAPEPTPDPTGPTGGPGSDLAPLPDLGQPAFTSGGATVAGQDRTVLADPRQFAAPRETEGRPPVSGLRGADPGLEELARASGTTFIVMPPHRALRRFSSLLRRFNREPVQEPPPGAIPEVAHAAPLELIPVDALNGINAAAVPDQETDAVNAQQRWNQLRRIRGAFQRGAIASTPEPTADASPGLKPHPYSYLAPMPDFLSGDALLAEMEEFAAVAGAAGMAVDFRISPDDRRIGLDFTSDPDERVRPSNPAGFGDPI